jgi:hypothetical protein
MKETGDNKSISLPRPSHLEIKHSEGQMTRIEPMTSKTIQKPQLEQRQHIRQARVSAVTSAVRGQA